MRLLTLSLGLAGLVACTGATPGDNNNGNGDSDPVEDLDVDSDGDGLTDAEEADLGTDPDSSDSDMDGWDDLEEVDAGSDPNVCWDVVEGWPDCTGQSQADGYSGEGWQVGQTQKSWGGVDQYGGEVDSSQFYGMVLVVDMSAGWCGPCRSAAASAEDWYQEHADDGVQLVHLMVDDNSNDGFVTDPDFTADWADQYGLTFPVLSDDSKNGYAKAYYNWYQQGYIEGIPTFAVIGRDGTLIDIWAGESESRLNTAIADGS
ncbi:MAG: TlpA family protein disulfide reductase [Proteobacteria bacterium]|nr:TlpA family protein disulfide reductase [Pseudomonadota bacterium]